jgi:hypothetical protein
MSARRQSGEQPGTDGVAAVVDLSRLTAGLRLMFPAGVVREIVPDPAQLGSNWSDATINRARRRYQLQAWSERLRRVWSALHRLRVDAAGDRPAETSHECPPLAHHSGLSADGAILLALHAGAGLPLDHLSSTLGLDDERAGEELYRARQQVTGCGVHACESMRSAIGRHADHQLTRNRQIAPRQHLASCPACHTVYDAHIALDRRLAGLFADRLDEPLAHDAGRLRPGWATVGPAAVLTPLIALVLLALTSMTGLLPGSGHAEGPVPLFARADDFDHPGWLILSSPSEVLLISLQDGERRRLIENPGPESANPLVVSPDGRYVVKWEETQRLDHLAGALRVYDLNGSLAYLHRSLDVATRHFSGWLDNETVLFVERGAVGSAVPAAAAASLLAIHLPTGVEREIYHGPLLRAIASPNGEHLAIIYPVQGRSRESTVEIRPFDGERAGAPVNRVAHRVLTTPNIVVWSPDGSEIITSLIARDDAVPDLYDSTHLGFVWPLERGAASLAILGVNGSQREFAHDFEYGRVLPQAVSPDGQTIAVLFNTDITEQRPWRYGTIDRDTGALSRSDYELGSGRVWGGETVWLPGSQRRVFQQLTPFRLDATESRHDTGESLVLMTEDMAGNVEPLVVFHDALSAGVRGQSGFSILRWVPDSIVSADRPPDLRPPEPGSPRRVEEAGEALTLFGDSRVAPTSRHILLQEHYPEEGTILRLMHMRAWGGTSPRIHDWGEFAWLPSESAAIGTTGIIGHPEQASRLVVLATESMSPLHGRYLDPAGLGQQTHLRYRRPTVSPTGTTTVFFVQDRQAGVMALWVAGWDRAPRSVQQWEMPTNAQVDPQLSARWIAHDTLVFSRPSEWRDGYPHRSTLMRVVVGADREVVIEELTDVTAGGRDRGVGIIEIALSPDEEYVAFRVRYYAGNRSGDADVDAIRVSPAGDITQQIEVVRAGPGYGMVWMHDGRWIVAGVDNRVAMLDYTWRSLRYITTGPSAYPVLVGESEIWYQDLSPRGRIMRFTLYGTT